MKFEFILLFLIRNGGKLFKCVLIISDILCFDSVLILDSVIVSIFVVIVMVFVWKFLLDRILLVGVLVLLLFLIKINGLLFILLVFIIKIFWV